MGSLKKLDLEPNEIYNVSFNIKQGNKTVDTLRFFQTQVPKLYNINTPNYSAFSQVTEKPDAVQKKDKYSGGGFVGGSANTILVTSVKVKVTKGGSFSEGQLNSTPSDVVFDFTIGLESEPKMMGYVLSGFDEESVLKLLNNRSDYRAEGKNLRLSLTLAQVDPASKRTETLKQVTDTVSLLEDIKYKDSILKVNKLPKSFKPGASRVVLRTGNSYVFPAGFVVSKASVSGGVYLLMGSAAIIGVTAPKNIPFVTDFRVQNDFDGDIYKKLVAISNLTNDKGVVTGTRYYTKNHPTFVHQTFAEWKAPSVTSKYTFSQNNYITSSVNNPNVIESLIWEDTVRDYIYFVIADRAKKDDYYYFGNYGDITAAVGNTPLTGTIKFSPSKPPDAPEEVTTPQEPTFPRTSGRKLFYDSSLVERNTETFPDLKRPIIVRFALARYTKTTSGWSGEWLPLNAKTADDILSLPEALE
jgi:hypothetical protein